MYMEKLLDDIISTSSSFDDASISMKNGSLDQSHSSSYFSWSSSKSAEELQNHSVLRFYRRSILPPILCEESRNEMKKYKEEAIKKEHIKLNKNQTKLIDEVKSILSKSELDVSEDEQIPSPAHTYVGNLTQDDEICDDDVKTEILIAGAKEEDADVCSELSKSSREDSFDYDVYHKSLQNLLQKSMSSEITDTDSPTGDKHGEATNSTVQSIDTIVSNRLRDDDSAAVEAADGGPEAGVDHLIRSVKLDDVNQDEAVKHYASVSVASPLAPRPEARCADSNGPCVTSPLESAVLCDESSAACEDRASPRLRASSVDEIVNATPSVDAVAVSDLVEAGNSSAAKVEAETDEGSVSRTGSSAVVASYGNLEIPVEDDDDEDEICFDDSVEELLAGLNQDSTSPEPERSGNSSTLIRSNSYSLIAPSPYLVSSRADHTIQSADEQSDVVVDGSDVTVGGVIGNSRPGSGRDNVKRKLDLQDSNYQPCINSISLKDMDIDEYCKLLQKQHEEEMMKLHQDHVLQIQQLQLEVEAKPEADDDEVMRRGWARLSALVKGHLTRQLFWSRSSLLLMQTIRDTSRTILAIQADPVKSQQEGVLLQRLFTQLRAALYDFHDLFFAASKREQMTMIRASPNTQQHKKHKATHRPKWNVPKLSKATQKSLERKRNQRSSYKKQSPGQKTAAAKEVKSKISHLWKSDKLPQTKPQKKFVVAT